MTRDVASTSPGVLPRRPKTGGRKKGTPNKSTVARKRAIEAIKASGKDPVTFFADLLRNEDAPLELRFQAAEELAPFVHPKLASIEARTGGHTHTKIVCDSWRLCWPTIDLAAVLWSTAQVPLMRQQRIGIEQQGKSRTGGFGGTPAEILMGRGRVPQRPYGSSWMRHSKRAGERLPAE
jgi:hypothetical protein